MNAPLHVLLVEDSPEDAKLCVRELVKSGLAVESERVDDAGALRRALDSGRFHIVLSDWSMPGFGAMDALRIVQAMRPEMPFVIVSGTIGEETAVEAVRAGAHDYVSKDHLSRLPLAVGRALRDCENHALRRRAEAALRESELRFSRLWESGIIGIALSDMGGEVQEANDVCLALIGATRADLGAKRLDWKNISPPEERSEDRAAMQSLKTHGFAAPRQKRLVGPSGDTRTVMFGAAAIERERIIAFLVDISEQKQAEALLRKSEEQLLQAQKMEAVGRLAGGIAHDFNNLLSVILGYAGLAIEERLTEGADAEDLRAIQEAGQRAAELTKQLLAFSRRQVLAPRVVDLDDVVRGLLGLLGRLIGEDVALEAVLTASQVRVRVDPSQIEQVVMNLVVNARDAMPRGGSLSLASAVVDLDASDATEVFGLPPGRYVRLDVVDTGSGMDAETRARIFEPFFTTKELGKGTGLGLATVHGIVQQSGGSIVVASELGHGTRFSIYLPSVEAALDQTDKRGPPERLAGSETVLVVEDEPQVRKLVCTALKRLGYRVVEARNAGDALLLADDEAFSFDLLLTDVVMPGMNGLDLARRLRAARPELKVLLMSGYLDQRDGRSEMSTSASVEEARFAFLQKPITPDVLAVRVREVLDLRVER